MEPRPQITALVPGRVGALQVCVPDTWTEVQIVEFAQSQCIVRCVFEFRRTGDPRLGGHDERRVCRDRDGCVHMILDFRYVDS